jgi:hypothetical protein
MEARLFGPGGVRDSLLALCPHEAKEHSTGG